MVIEKASQLVDCCRSKIQVVSLRKSSDSEDVAYMKSTSSPGSMEEEKEIWVFLFHMRKILAAMKLDPALQFSERLAIEDPTCARLLQKDGTFDHSRD